jgi:DNA-binding transcriptional regulator/RsmH inhibitor MraZ
VELDKQYRFAIPDASRELAGIQKDVCLVGREERVQIYARDRWEDRQKARTERMKPPTGAKRGRPAIPVEIVGEQP